MRGTLHIITVRQDRRGIIPAYAGNTSNSERAPAPTRDHPRVCGEHLHRWGIYGMSKGSSPRMRGTHEGRMHTYGFVGIIPAYAGNTSGCVERPWSTRDHPRVCGEHPDSVVLTVEAEGSSPRMRGTHPDIFVCADTKGIIPAYAGNTYDHLFALSCQRDHPRVCGEHSWSAVSGIRCRGSSPRMRGTRCQSAHHRRRRGIIPAYAGNTPGPRREHVQERDHPRVCGEHTKRL